MSEKELENVTPETEEVVEEIAEAVVENDESAVEDVIDTDEQTFEEANEFVDEVSDTVDEVTEDGVVSKEELEEVVEEIIQKKKSKAPVFVVVILIILAIIAALAYNAFGGNPYNKLGYANPGGRTIQDVADDLGITLDEFLTNYSLPADMPADTEEMNAYYSMPTKVFSQMYGLDFATMKEAFGIPDETTPPASSNIIDKIKSLFGSNNIQTIDENTPWGVVLDELTLGKYIGEENLQTYIEYYGLKGDITVDTRYKEIRKQVEKKTMELAAQAEAEANAAQAEAEGADAATEQEVDTEVAPDAEQAAE